MARKPVEKAIFIGRGLPKDAPASFMNWGFVNLDPDGNPVDPSTLPPDYDMGSLKLGGIALLVGKQNIMPNWDGAETQLRNAVASENFAHPRMQEQIDGWLAQGIDGEALHDLVKENKGLVTLKDFGLEELPVTDSQPQKQGG